MPLKTATVVEEQLGTHKKKSHNETKRAGTRTPYFSKIEKKTQHQFRKKQEQERKKDRKTKKQHT